MKIIDGDALAERIKREHCEGCHDMNGLMCRECPWMEMLDMIDDTEAIEDDC